MFRGAKKCNNYKVNWKKQKNWNKYREKVFLKNKLELCRQNVWSPLLTVWKHLHTLTGRNGTWEPTQPFISCHYPPIWRNSCLQQRQMEAAKPKVCSLYLLQKANEMSRPEQQGGAGSIMWRHWADGTSECVWSRLTWGCRRWMTVRIAVLMKRMLYLVCRWDARCAHKGSADSVGSQQSGEGPPASPTPGCYRWQPSPWAWPASGAWARPWSGWLVTVWP